VSDAARAGADGFIVPDLPLEEADVLEAACRENGCALVYLLAPTSTPDRLARIAAHSSGFIYLVSVAGVTGARNSLPPDLQEFIQRVRQHTSLPLAIGFGISTPGQAAEVGHLAEGVIIGSALIKAVENAPDPVRTAGAFVAELKAALG
jgi:tryptophan synthase alpha chain